MKYSYYPHLYYEKRDHVSDKHACQLAAYLDILFSDGIPCYLYWNVELGARYGYL